jgi:hypothetical protein
MVQFRGSTESCSWQTVKASMGWTRGERSCSGVAMHATYQCGGDPLCQKASRDVHCGYYETCTVHISNSTSPITTEMSKGACQKKPGATIKPHFEWISYVFLP